MTIGGVAVVTGGGSGLGRLIARTLLTGGWKVVVAGRREQPLQQTIKGELGTNSAWSREAALAVPTDITSPDSVAALFDAVRDRFGRLDLLVNNAGMFGPSGSVDELSPQLWQQVVDTNLTGSFLCAHHAVKMMKAQKPQGGRIINNGSVSAHSPRPTSVGYTATKHAITGLTRSISLDGRKHNIACGQIDIGNAITDMTVGVSRGVAQADGSVRPEATFKAQHAADAVLYMASLPLNTNVQFMTVIATAMPFIGRG